MELDHIFVFVEPGGGAARQQLTALGLTETYSREHPGQGTANVCYAFDNAFLELLWLSDRAAAESPAIARTGLAARADWQALGSSPFGIAWRLSAGEAQPVETWSYCPPYLPAGVAIPVATMSDDVSQPFVFASPGTQAPIDWPEARRGRLQQDAGFCRIEAAILYHTAMSPPHPQLQVLVDQGLLQLRDGDSLPRLDLQLRRKSGERVSLSLPSGEILPP